MGYEEKLEKELNTEPSPLSVTKTRAKLDKAIETVEKHNAIVAEALSANLDDDNRLQSRSRSQARAISLRDGASKSSASGV